MEGQEKGTSQLQREGTHLLCLVPSGSLHTGWCPLPGDAGPLHSVRWVQGSSLPAALSQAHPEITFYRVSGHALDRSSWKHKVNYPAFLLACLWSGLENTRLSSRMAAPLCIPTSSAGRFLFYIDPSIDGFSVLDLEHSPMSHFLFNVCFLSQNNLFSSRNRDMKGELFS